MLSALKPDQRLKNKDLQGSYIGNFYSLYYWLLQKNLK